VLIYLVEVASASPRLVHGLGLSLVAGRLSHAYGVSQLKESYGFRVTGMALTLTTIVTCSAILLYLYIKYSVT
jgi:uncharacterized membrane protein YecN with MAPEG domain